MSGSTGFLITIRLSPAFLLTDQLYTQPLGCGRGPGGRVGAVALGGDDAVGAADDEPGATGWGDAEMSGHANTAS